MACFIECRHDDAVLVNEFCPTFEHGNIFLFDDLRPNKYKWIQDIIIYSEGQEGLERGA